jgi:FkbM family methyltransferase
MSLRRLAELASRGRTLRRHLPKRFGNRPLYVSPDAALRWLKPGSQAFEANLLELVDHWVKPGMVVWDIGANVGAFAFPAAHRSGAAVVAVEADPFLAGLLRRSASAAGNRDLDVRILPVAVSDADGIAEFAIAGRGRAANGLISGAISTQHGDSRQILLAPTLTADTMLNHLPAPGLVKVDIEGAELFFLAGARRLLREIRPTLYLETCAETRAEVDRILAGAGYRSLSGESGLAAPPPATSDDVNILAVPMERDGPAPAP